MPFSLTLRMSCKQILQKSQTASPKFCCNRLQNSDQGSKLQQLRNDIQVSNVAFFKFRLALIDIHLFAKYFISAAK
jgi:hypothetical protein